MTTITLPDRLYVKLREMAEQYGVTVPEAIRPYLEVLADLPREQREKALKYMRLLRAGESQWTEVIDTMLARADLD